MADNIITKTPVVLCPPDGAAHLVSEKRRLVLLIRHGQTDWNTVMRLQGREAVPLNDRGALQAKECGETLFEAMKYGLEIDKVCTSPLGRAKDTAKYITGEIRKDRAEIFDELTERDYGALSGTTPDERRALRAKGFVPAESVPDAAKRMRRALNAICRAEEDGDAVVAVTHGGVINALFSVITGGAIGTGKNFSENCGISLVAYGTDATIPLAYGLTREMFLDYAAKYSRRLAELTKE